MSLFQRLSPSDFTPLVTFLNEFEPARYSKHSSVKAFRPRFDVSEVKDSYQLQGELPGLDQSNVNLEFTDSHTLIIKGRSVRDSPQDGSNTEAAEATSEAAETEHSYHKASVEDESSTTTDGANTPATSTATAAEDGHKDKSTPKAKYWLSERSVGEFHRSFSFPSRVDQDAVTASLKNGILSVIIPKAPAPVSRRIDIS